MVLGKLDSYMQKNEIGLDLNTLTKVKSKYIEGFNIRPVTINVLEEFIGKNLLDIDLGNDFLDMTPKV